MADYDFPVIKAPWSPQQVDALNHWQALGYVHEFTCGNEHEGSRILFATRQGWICAHCDYRQDWAHQSMFGPRPDRIKSLPCDVMLPPATIIHKGCEYSTLFVALHARDGLPADVKAEWLRFDDPAADAINERWQPVQTKPQFIECEERGRYTSDGAGLWFFKPTHWRPLL